MQVTQKQLRAFQQYVLKWYAQHGRHQLPWRQTTDPYHILVSELMLQQTQVDRVIPKYLAFLKRFPTVTVLAQSSLAEVLTLWQGLGYNRRAKFLLQTAQAVLTNNGIFPQTQQQLQQLPGIGRYTASAIAAFAYNQPIVVLETNIRSVFIHHFFPGASTVGDKELLPLIEQTIWKNNPREWYAALMDYGSHLKKILPNPSRKSKTYSKQSKFEGSPRQVRGAIIRALTLQSHLNKAELKSKITGNLQHFDQALEQLVTEGMVEQTNNQFHLAQT